MPEITVASTTDTQQAVELAASLNEASRGEISSQQTEPLTAEGAEEHGGNALKEEGEEDTAEGGATRSSAGQAKEPQPRLPRGVQRLPREQEWVDGQEDAAKGNSTRAELSAARPTPAQYRSYEEFVEALADWKAGQRLEQQRQAEFAQAEQERTREVFDTYNEAIRSARTKYADFEQVVGRRDLKIPQAVQGAIIEAGSSGPDIAYYLGKHPEACQELTEMSPMRAIARIGQIEMQVTHGTPGPAAGNRQQGTGSQESGARSQNLGRARTLPAPISPVGGSSSRGSVPLSELPYRDYKRLRDQEERANRG